MKILSVLLCVFILTSASFSQPSTQPTTREVILELQRQISLATADLEKAVKVLSDAETTARARFESLDSTKQARAEANVALRVLERARTSGSAKEQSDASNEYARIRVPVEAEKTRSVNSDAAVGLAKGRVDQARRNLQSARAAMAAEEDRLAALRQAREDADPIKRAIKERRFIVGMTVSQAEGVMAANRFEYRVTERRETLVVGVPHTYETWDSKYWYPGVFNKIRFRDGIVVEVEKD